MNGQLTAAGTSQLQVMTWNLQHASAERTVRQVAWLADQPGADVAILTEVSAGAGMAALTESLTARGYGVVVPEVSGPRTVVVATRVGAAIRVEGLYRGRLAHRAVGARLVLPGGGMCGVIGLYVPSRGPRDRRNVDKRAFQVDVTAALPGMVRRFGDAPVVVGGALNVVEPGHRPRHAVFDAWEYDFYRGFDTAGLTDGFRHLHPDVEDHSWFGRAQRGYRFDHLFCTTAHIDAVVGSAYLHEPRQHNLSDHAPHTITLQVPTPT